MSIAHRLPAALRDDTGGAVLYGLLAATAIAVLVALILFIQRRPRGLFPQTGRAAEN